MTHDNAKKVINNITENYGIILHSIILYHQFYKYIFNRFLLNEKLANEKLTYVENNTSFVDQ